MHICYHAEFYKADKQSGHFPRLSEKICRIVSIKIIFSSISSIVSEAKILNELSSENLNSSLSENDKKAFILANSNELKHELHREFEQIISNLFERLKDESLLKFKQISNSNIEIANLLKEPCFAMIHYGEIQFDYIGYDRNPNEKNSILLKFQLIDQKLIATSYLKQFYEIDSKLKIYDKALLLITESNSLKEKIAWLLDHIKTAKKNLREEEDKNFTGNSKVEISKIQKNIKRYTEAIKSSEDKLANKKQKLEETNLQLKKFKTEGHINNISSLELYNLINEICNSTYKKSIEFQSPLSETHIHPENKPVAKTFEFSQLLTKTNVLVAIVASSLSFGTLNYDLEMINFYDEREEVQIAHEVQKESFLETINNVLENKLVANYLSQKQKNEIRNAGSKERINKLIASYFATGKNSSFEDAYHAAVEPHNPILITPMLKENSVAFSFNAKVIEAIKEKFGEDISFGFTFYSKSGKAKTILHDEAPYLAIFEKKNFLEIRGFSFVVSFNLADEVTIMSTSTEDQFDAQEFVDEYFFNLPIHLNK